MDKKPDHIFCSEIGAYEYVNIETKASMSLNLGVKPALTTLSDAAMHSMISPAEVGMNIICLQEHSLTNLELDVVEEEEHEKTNVPGKLFVQSQDQICQLLSRC